MDERFDLNIVNVKLRDAITSCLQCADDATRKKIEEIVEIQPHDPDDKDLHDNLKLRKQALIGAGAWSDASQTPVAELFTSARCSYALRRILFISPRSSFGR